MTIDPVVAISFVVIFGKLKLEIVLVIFGREVFGSDGIGGAWRLLNGELVGKGDGVDCKILTRKGVEVGVDCIWSK